MSGHLPRTNRWLVLLSVILCIVLGGIFTRSSSAPSQVSASSETGFFVSGDQDSSEFTSEETVADNNDNFTDTSSGDSNNVPDSSSVKNSSEDSSKTSRNKSSENAGKKSDVSSNSPALSSEVSAEASKGIWASSGSNWMFLIDNIPYTGWLTDTDGKQYYMDNAGIMQTGWTDIGNKRYYFDMDGILQTGTVNINGKSYELNEDGSLKNYTARNLLKRSLPKNPPKSLQQNPRVNPPAVQIPNLLILQSPSLLHLTTGRVPLQTVFWTVWKKIMQRQLSLWWVLRLPVFRTK